MPTEFTARLKMGLIVRKLNSDLFKNSTLTYLFIKCWQPLPFKVPPSQWSCFQGQVRLQCLAQGNLQQSADIYTLPDAGIVTYQHMV